MDKEVMKRVREELSEYGVSALKALTYILTKLSEDDGREPPEIIDGYLAELKDEEERESEEEVGEDEDD